MPQKGRGREAAELPWLRYGWESLLAFLLPDICLACALVAQPGEPLEMGLCGGCRDGLVAAPWPSCGGCGRPLGAAGDEHGIPRGFRCGACRRHPPAFDGLLTCWSYRPPLDRVIHGLKFRRLEYLGRQLVPVLARRVRFAMERGEIPGPPGLPELVTPVPLHWLRRHRRGFNQAERIARPLARALDLPLVSTLRRRSATRRQTRLGRGHRQRNLRGAFLPRRRASKLVAGRTVLLVDDVFTTGATLDAASRALKAAGAGRVLALAAARTPEPGE